MKSLLQKSAFLVSAVLVFPLLVITFVEKRATGQENVFRGVSQLLSLVPFRFGVYVRSAYYANTCNQVHREVAVGFMTLLSHSDIDIGKNVYIGPQSNIGSCAIGVDCVIGSGVHILSGKHQHDFSSLQKPIREQGGTYEKIRIGKDCWIGNQAIILATVGDQCIVAAGSVVVDDVPTRSIVAGNPARILKSRR